MLNRRSKATAAAEGWTYPSSGLPLAEVRLLVRRWYRPGLLLREQAEQCYPQAAPQESPSHLRAEPRPGLPQELLEEEPAAAST